jgi:hypothetical protein
MTTNTIPAASAARGLATGTWRLGLALLERRVSRAPLLRPDDRQGPPI